MTKRENTSFYSDINDHRRGLHRQIQQQKWAKALYFKVTNVVNKQHKAWQIVAKILSPNANDQEMKAAGCLTQVNHNCKIHSGT